MCQHKMSINFDRNNSQVMYESFIGADAESLLDKKEEFKNLMNIHASEEKIVAAIKKMA